MLSTEPFPSSLFLIGWRRISQGTAGDGGFPVGLWKNPHGLQIFPDGVGMNLPGVGVDVDDVGAGADACRMLPRGL